MSSLSLRASSWSLGPKTKTRHDLTRGKDVTMGKLKFRWWESPKLSKSCQSRHFRSMRHLKASKMLSVIGVSSGSSEQFGRSKSCPETTGKDLAFSLLVENILYASSMDPSVKLFKLKGSEMPPNVVFIMLMLLSSMRPWRQKVNTSLSSFTLKGQLHHQERICQTWSWKWKGMFYFQLQKRKKKSCLLQLQLFRTKPIWNTVWNLQWTISIFQIWDSKMRVGKIPSKRKGKKVTLFCQSVKVGRHPGTWKSRCYKTPSYWLSFFLNPKIPM